jgi:hypothetical protein
MGVAGVERSQHDVGGHAGSVVAEGAGITL